MKLTLLEQAFQSISQQHWPASSLYMIATPIGNLSDISLRALYALQLVDVIACEDTRSSKVLLNQWGIQTPLIALHRHNEREASQSVLSYLAEGKRVAYISDAGTPAISDPGGKLVADILNEGFRVIPLPGPCAAVTALMASGLSDDESPAFLFAGFVPSKGKQAWLEQYASFDTTVVFYEAPHRILDTARLFEALFEKERRVVVARELTKRFEEISVQTVETLTQWLEADHHRQQGEFVLLLEGKKSPVSTQADYIPLLKILLEEGVSAKDASRIVARFGGGNKKQIYQEILNLKASD
ncbi:hypothetical protein IX83_01205 [Basilea psittacipulmonis DSM 24701]|uniref:Ribosomal RNA small subunit methyltransferase I n=2 Tax=Basilea TaxID=1472344 RepID=A0A077DG41_9BURK|nr:hypothetical protein IX83_01205 [Basilea psittacipulmonis DSM 24701]